MAIGRFQQKQNIAKKLVHTGFWVKIKNNPAWGGGII